MEVFTAILKNFPDLRLDHQLRVPASSAEVP